MESMEQIGPLPVGLYMHSVIFANVLETNNPGSTYGKIFLRIGVVVCVLSAISTAAPLRM